jgi:hypothetical protein
MKGVEESASSPDEKTPAGWYKWWSKECEAAKKRLRKFKKQGDSITNRYLDERAGDTADGVNGARGDIPSKLNLFHKNINTTQSMLYGQTPRVDVSREHHDPDDDVARVAGMLIQRILQADVEPSGEGVAEVLRAALQDRLIPGFGVARVRYDMQTVTQPVMDPLTGEIAETEVLSYEDAPIDYVHWQDVLWGWGRTFNEIPWWGFRAWLTKDEATARFGEKKAESLTYINQLPGGADNKDSTQDADQKNNIQKAEIWEYWNKQDKKVYWWSSGADLILDVMEDPLQLDGFWPMPKPLIANNTTTLYVPKSDFTFAQDLYNEIDILQSRIATITRAIKVVGVYDKSASESVGRMLKEGNENDLIPVDNWAMFAEKGGLSGVVDWFPVETVVATLQTLQGIQQDKIAQLYEITGMSEIMSGSAGGQYTAAASNQIAAKMGSINIQALQDEFARFASDLSALKAEVIAKHFNPQTIMQQASAAFVPQADKDKVMPAVQLIKSPDIKWRIDIRPESIAMIDYAQLKSERTEFLTAMSTYIQSASAAVQAVPGSLPILLELMKWGMAGFKGADYMEGTFDQAIDMAKKMPPPSDDKDDGKEADNQAKMQLEQLKQQGDRQKEQAEMQKIMTKSQADQQLQQSKVQGEIAKINADHGADMTSQQTSARDELMKIEANLAANLREIDANLRANLAVEEAQSTFAIAEQQVQHRDTLAEMAAQPKPTTGSDDDG